MNVQSTLNLLNNSVDNPKNPPKYLDQLDHGQDAPQLPLLQLLSAKNKSSKLDQGDFATDSNRFNKNADQSNNAKFESNNPYLEADHRNNMSFDNVVKPGIYKTIDVRDQGDSLRG